MNREIKKITTPIDNIEIELFEWLTGGEKRNITNSLLDNQDLQMSGASQNFKISSEVINKAQDIGFKTVVVSVGGNKENIVDSILNLKSKDFDFIVDEINKITNDDEELKKK